MPFFALVFIFNFFRLPFFIPFYLSFCITISRVYYDYLLNVATVSIAYIYDMFVRFICFVVVHSELHYAVCAMCCMLYANVLLYLLLFFHIYLLYSFFYSFSTLFFYFFRIHISTYFILYLFRPPFLCWCWFIFFSIFLYFPFFILLLFLVSEFSLK